MGFGFVLQSKLAYFVYALRTFLKNLLLVTEKASTSGVRDVTRAFKNALLNWFSPSLMQVMINSLCLPTR